MACKKMVRNDHGISVLPPPKCCFIRSAENHFFRILHMQFHFLQFPIHSPIHDAHSTLGHHGLRDRVSFIFFPSRVRV